MSSQWARSPSPPLLRGPSPLGARPALQFRDDGTVEEGVPPPLVRSSSVPPFRPPSPGSASPALRSPVVSAQARRTSRREFQKIDSGALRALISRTVTEVQRMSRALIRVEAKISKQWTVPQRAVRTVVKGIALQFTTNGQGLIQHLEAVSASSRHILNFVGTCIRATHGLQDFDQFQRLEPVLNELRTLRTQWSSLRELEGKFGEALSDSTLTLEEAADPDNWVPGSEISLEVCELADTHLALEACFTKVAAFFKDLTVASWQPPLLSPEDVKLAADQWRSVEQNASSSIGRVRAAIQGLVEHTVSCSFMSPEEGDKMLALISVDAVSAVGGKVRERERMGRERATTVGGGWREG